MEEKYGKGMLGPTKSYKEKETVNFPLNIPVLWFHCLDW